MFKELKYTETVEHIVKVFEMKSLCDMKGLIVLNKTALSLDNPKFVDSIQNSFMRGNLVPKEILFSTSFVAFYNDSKFRNKILILRNRWTGDVGLFDYL